VLCGQAPENKTREHVLPRWLLELTGDPRREANLGIDWTKTPPKPIKFSFDQYFFPACDPCNSKYGSVLEGPAKAYMKSMLDGEKLSASEIEHLFDWFDKVRIGVWLGSMTLNKNPVGIEPKFAVADRMGTKDRLLFVYRDRAASKGLTVIANTPIFWTMPSCFGLSINDLHFFNVSSDFLFSFELGLPYAKAPEWESDLKAMSISIASGTETMCLPLTQLAVRSGGTELYQPMMFDCKPNSEQDKIRPYYETPYAREFFPDSKNPRGVVWRKTSGGIEKYPSHSSLDWRPPMDLDRKDILRKLTIAVMESQSLLFSKFRSTASTNFLEETDRENQAESAKEILQMQDDLFQSLKKSLAM